MSEQQLSQYLRASETTGRPVILFADIDGTLVDKSMQVSEADRRAIDEFIARGHYFAVATGRGRVNAEYHIHDLPSNFPAIFANGATLYDRGGGRPILEHDLSTQGMSELFRRMKEFYPEIMIQIYQPDAIYLVTDNPDTDHRVAEHHPYVRADFAAMEGDRATKVLFGMTEENCDDGHRIAQAFVEANHSDLRVVKSQSLYLEVTPHDVSKGKMIRFVREHTNAYIVAAGDYLNDIEMMREADLAFTLVTAPAEVQEAADRVLDSRPGEFISTVIREVLAELENESVKEK